jgi:soluble lytic murein transglycosylase-like protein
MGWIWIALAAYSAAASAQSQNGSSGAAGQTAPANQQQASIARQLASIRQQAAGLSLRMVPWSGPPPVFPDAAPPPPCDPVSEEIVAPLIDSAAKANTLDPKLIRAVMEQESALRPCAVSAKGAQGLMQLMPETARELQVEDPFDPAQNVRAGARYLKQLLDKYGGNMAQALAAYNAGPNNVDQSGGIPDIPETRSYVTSILEKLGIKPAREP